MNRSSSIVCGLPFCPEYEAKQTDLSTGLRISAVTLGLITISGGIFISCSTLNLSALGSTVKWIAFSGGGLCLVLGASLKSELQDLSISQETVEKIQANMPKILTAEPVEGFKFYTSRNDHRVFEVDLAPGLIFKMKVSRYSRSGSITKDDSISARYQKMLLAQEVCRVHRLGLLVIPKATLFTLTAGNTEYEILAELKLDITPNAISQEQYYEDDADSLDEAIRQLAIFICKTGYSDVEWRNNPVLNNSLDSNGHRKLALIDIEEMGSTAIGLFGGRYKRGLVRCVTERQGHIVYQVAQEHRHDTSFFAESHANRLRELKEKKALRQYYQQRNIVRGNEPIVVDVETIDFSPDSQESKKVQTVARNLIDIINDALAKSSPDESINGRRLIHINTQSDERFCQVDKELDVVITKLSQMGLIFTFVKRNGHRYSIQA